MTVLTALHNLLYLCFRYHGTHHGKQIGRLKDQQQQLSKQDERRNQLALTLGHHSNIIDNDKDGRVSGGSENEIEFGRRTGVGSGVIGTQSSSFRDVSGSGASLQNTSRIVARAAASTGRSHRPPLSSQDRNSGGVKPPRSVETTRSRNSSFGSGKSPTKLGHYTSPYGQGNRRLTPRQRSRSLTPSGRRANDTTVASSILNSSLTAIFKINF